MITRIEIDGFKSFLDFQLDVPPFLAIVGPNSSGKSNLFDAIEFDQQTQRLAEPLLEARRGRPQELFHQVSSGEEVRTFRIAVTRLVGVGGDRREVVTEELAERLGSRITLTSAESPPEDSLLREAVQAEVHYVPDPDAMRRTAPAADRRPLLRNGANLAAVLGRIAGTDAVTDVLIDLAALIPGVSRVVTQLDEHRQEWSFDVVINGQSVPSTLLSDGTLRILGLLAAFHDPDHPGTLLVGEIENSLHPSRLAELLRRFSERVTDLNDPAALDRPLRQVILTSHSPVVVSELARKHPETLVFMESVFRTDPDWPPSSRVSTVRPVRNEGEKGTYISPRRVRDYLSVVQQEGM